MHWPWSGLHVRRWYRVSGFIPPIFAGSRLLRRRGLAGSHISGRYGLAGSRLLSKPGLAGSQAPCSNQFDHETKWPPLIIYTYSKWPKSQSRYHISPYDLSFAANYVSEFLAVIYYINWTGCVHIAYHTGWNIHVRSTKRKVSQNWRHHIDCSISS